MGEFLTAEVIAVLVLALLALVAGGRLGDAGAAGLVALLIAVPLVRVLWLVLRWFRKGDLRFALVGTFVICVAVAGWVLSR